MPRKPANRALLSPDINLPPCHKKNTAGFWARRLVYLTGGEDSKSERYVVGAAVIFFCLMAFTLSTRSSAIFRSLLRASAVVSMSAFWR